jgi:hypothetical protein
MDEVVTFAQLPFKKVGIAIRNIFVGVLGSMIILLFSVWACSAVGRLAKEVVNVARSQFIERSGIIDYEEEHDYGCCVGNCFIYATGFFGKKACGSNYDLQVQFHCGAGAYICGEETALLESNSGIKLFYILGHSNKTCTVEEEMNISLKELIERHGSGLRGGWNNLITIIIGGSSNFLLPKHIGDAMMMAYEALGATQSRLELIHPSCYGLIEQFTLQQIWRSMTFVFCHKLLENHHRTTSVMI